MVSSSWDMSVVEEEILHVQKEDEGVAIGGGEEDKGIDMRWCLVGRFLSDRDFDFDIMQNVLTSLWKPGMGMFGTPRSTVLSYLTSLCSKFSSLMEVTQELNFEKESRILELDGCV
uniref:Uncharacterized protein n=1 Tax=Cannabis sativa TaxID=3483 RepID=A0A803PBR7_CANSA